MNKNFKQNLYSGRKLFWVVLTVFSVGFFSHAAYSKNDHEYVTEKGIAEYKDIGNKGERDTPVTSLSGRMDTSTTDHATLKELEGPFNSGPEVTRACLSCHNKAGHQFKKNKHWTWKYTHPKTGQKLGKSVLINNFCTNARGNEGMCAQCHAGFGMKETEYDFNNEENIDCLVCHESTGQYYKTPTSSGNKACSVMFKDKEPID